MKRTSLQTTVAKETKSGLEQIATREKLTDHGIPSKGRAIDWLVQKHFDEENAWKRAVEV